MSFLRPNCPWCGSALGLSPTEPQCDVLACERCVYEVDGETVVKARHSAPSGSGMAFHGGVLRNEGRPSVRDLHGRRPAPRGVSRSFDAVVYKGQPPVVVNTPAGPVRMYVATVPSIDQRCACYRCLGDNGHMGQCARGPSGPSEIPLVPDPHYTNDAEVAERRAAMCREQRAALDQMVVKETVAQVVAVADVPAPVDPLDVKIDGMTLRDLLDLDQRHQREEGSRWHVTPAQRAAISAHWSAELRRKVAASAELERCRVLVDLQEVE